MIGEATRTIVEGNSHPKSVMQLRSSEGNKIYALQQASWGVFKDAYNKKDRFITSNCDSLHIMYNTASTKGSGYLAHYEHLLHTFTLHSK